MNEKLECLQTQYKNCRRLENEARELIIAAIEDETHLWSAATQGFKDGAKKSEIEAYIRLNTLFEYFYQCRRDLEYIETKMKFLKREHNTEEE